MKEQKIFDDLVIEYKQTKDKKCLLKMLDICETADELPWAVNNYPQHEDLGYGYLYLSVPLSLNLLANNYLHFENTEAIERTYEEDTDYCQLFADNIELGDFALTKMQELYDIHTQQCERWIHDNSECLDTMCKVYANSCKECDICRKLEEVQERLKEAQDLEAYQLMTEQQLNLWIYTPQDKQEFKEYIISHYLDKLLEAQINALEELISEN